MSPIQIDTLQGYLYVTHERLAEKRNRKTLAERTDRGHWDYAEGQSYNIAPESTLVSGQFFPFYAYILALREELSRWHFYALAPKTMHEPTPLRNIVTLAPDGADLAAFFNTMKSQRPRQFESVRRALRLLIPQIETFDVERSQDGFLQLIVRKGGTDYSSRVISEGTLRVLALLAMTNPLEPVTLVGIEEPENGVHPRRLRLIATLMENAAQEKGIQIFVNTHSPFLPRHFSENKLVICRGEDAGTVFEHIDGAGASRDRATMEARLDAGEEESISSITERIIRGDYGG